MKLPYAIAFLAAVSGEAHAYNCALADELLAVPLGDQTVDVFFTPYDNGAVEIELRSFGQRSLENDVSAYAAQVSSILPRDGCGETTWLHDVNGLVINGSLFFDSAVTTRQWLCVKTNGLCSKGLKIYECTWTLRSEDVSVRKTLNLDTTLSPRIEYSSSSGEPAKLFLDVKPVLEEMKSWEKAVLKTLGALGDIVDFSLWNLTDFGEAFEVNIPELQAEPKLLDVFPKVEGLRFDGFSAYFSDDQKGYGINITAHDRMSCFEAKEVYRYFAKKEHFDFLRRDAEISIEVIEGDSLWKISESYYSNGELFMALAAYNGIDPEAPLPAGTQILVPSVVRIVQRFGNLVDPGDSLWSLSKGDDGAFKSLIEEAMRKGRDPNLIFPLEPF